MRKIHGVSITNFKAEQIGDLFVCTATGQSRDGRTDTSTGAVPVAGLAGENLANALMKAETKAKRRLTLSLCGLGLLDETEVEGQSFAAPYQPAQAPVAISGPRLTLTEQLEQSVAATFRTESWPLMKPPAIRKAEALPALCSTRYQR